MPAVPHKQLSNYKNSVDKQKKRRRKQKGQENKQKKQMEKKKNKLFNLFGSITVKKQSEKASIKEFLIENHI